MNIRKIVPTSVKSILFSLCHQDAILGSMERFFYWYGKSIARFPALFICLSFGLVGLCSVGILKMRMENNGIRLWIPEDSSQRINNEWLWENFPPELRFSTMLFVADNVLDPDVIRVMYRYKASKIWYKIY